MKKTNESGRSMVEMLGVLAIMGVLSMGGLASYTMAMRSYRANEILQAASMLAMETRVREAAITDAGTLGISVDGCTKLESTWDSKDEKVTVTCTLNNDQSLATAVQNKAGTNTNNQVSVNTATEAQVQIVYNYKAAGVRGGATTNGGGTNGGGTTNGGS